MRPRFLLAALALAACTPSVAPVPSGRTSPAITDADLRARLYAIADDSMMGRETGSEGAYKASAYVAAEFARMGLQPAGDNGTWFQVVPFWTMAPDPASRLDVGGTTLSVSRDFLVVQSRRVTLQDTPCDLRRAGERHHPLDPDERCAGQARRSRPAAERATPACRPAGPVARRGGPGSGLPRPHGARTHRSRARGHAGRRHLSPAPGADGLALPPRSRDAARRRSGDARTGCRRARPSCAAASACKFTPVPWPARNVVAVLPGAIQRCAESTCRSRRTTITSASITAPVDHDSMRAFNRVIRPMGADSAATRPTRRRSGADPHDPRQPASPAPAAARLDPQRRRRRRHRHRRPSSRSPRRCRRGARAPAALDSLRRRTPPRKQACSARAWYTDHATVPLDSIVAEIDQDMIGRGTPSDCRTAAPAPAADVPRGRRREAPVEASSATWLEAANARQPLPFVFNYEYDAPGHPLQYYCRADHYSYARYGIPSVSMSRGEHLDYHQVTDEAQYIDYPRPRARVADGVRRRAVDRERRHAPRSTRRSRPTRTRRCRQ